MHGTDGRRGVGKRAQGGWGEGVDLGRAWRRYALRRLGGILVASRSNEKGTDLPKRQRGKILTGISSYFSPVDTRK